MFYTLNEYIIMYWVNNGYFKQVIKRSIGTQIPTFYTKNTILYPAL